MPRIHDYRYDPYANIPSHIQHKERHLVPVVSPFVVELCEVPVKSAPSTTSVKYISKIEGAQVTYGKALTEVSSTPSQGQYYPDYHTNADNNSGWNTGKLLFAAADAGKLVEVTYFGKGTLASVRANTFPAWWTDRGDGSDGDFCPTTNTTISGVKNYKSAYIKAGVTVTIEKTVQIKCQESFVCAGIITADGQGGAGGTRIRVSSDEITYLPGEPGVAGGNGGKGGAGYGNPGYGGSAAFFFGAPVPQSISRSYLHQSAVCPLICSGGGGGSAANSSTSYSPGGAGGGSIYVISKSIQLSSTGKITAKGLGTPAETSGSSGGGGGGVIILVAETIFNVGTVDVSGGVAGASSRKGEDGQPGYFKTVELGVM